MMNNADGSLTANSPLMMGSNNFHNTTFDQAGGGGGTAGFNNTMDNTNASFASGFKNRSAALTTEELRKARESRAAEALKMKDDQLQILSQQNANLLKTLDRLEEEANTIQLQKVAIEQENRATRDANFELQSKARAAETTAKRLQIEIADKEKQLRIMTDQNSELLRLLESEESLTAQLQGEVSELRAELDELRQKYNALLQTAKTHEELATKAAKEGQLRAEEIRLLRVEVEQLKQQNTELKMKTQIEVEALQEQLRVRKEKQYQLLEKLQAQEEAKRQAEDQVAGMEEQLRGLHARNVDLETQNKVESRSKSNIEEANKELQVENTQLYNQNKELQAKIERSEKERLRMEAEARDSGEKLREMAEKVFQVMERLKLAELGKTKAMEALKKKEQDMVSLQKKNARLIKEATEESKAKVKAEMDVKVLQEQVRALKKNNTSLAQKSKEEALQKVKVMEERDQLDEKLKTMESRLSFLLNKVQADEENRIVQAEDRKKLEAQVISYTEKCEELQHKLTELGESNRVITQAMRLKQEEINEVTMKYEHVVRELQAKETEYEKTQGNNGNDRDESNGNAPDDIENVRLNEGRGRFYVEAKSIGGGSLLFLKARKPQYKEWMDKHNVNDFLKKAQKTTRFRDLIVEKFAAIYGLLMVEEEEKTQLLEQIVSRDQHIEHQQKKLALVQDTLAIEEDAKRRMLLRYIHAVKEHAMAVNDGAGGVLQLPESNLGDEEIHALAALLRNNASIEELNLRNNQISDDGARALAAVLSGKSGLKLVDIRGNKISQAGIKSLAEALERCERVKHVYVHAGGKIEALGASRWANPRDANNTESNKSLQSKTLGTVETVCVVDVRDNNADSVSYPYALQGVAASADGFKPTTLLESAGVPTTQMLNSNFSPTQKKTKNKGSKSAVASSTDSGFQIANASSNANNGGEGSKKANKMKLHEEHLRMMKEMQWHGRKGGVDIDLAQSVDRSAVLAIKDVIKTKKKVNNRTALPPLGDSNNIDFNRDNSPPRGHSAPDLRPGGRLQESFGLDPNHPEAVIISSGKLNNPNIKEEVRDSSPKKGKKKKKMSETEKKLLQSPLAQPVMPRMTNPP